MLTRFRGRRSPNPKGRSAVPVSAALFLISSAWAQSVTTTSYPVGSAPFGIAFDGANIWVTNTESSTVTKLVASTGATVGTYPVATNPYGIVFDGTNIWVTNTAFGTVTKLLASTGGIVGTYPAGASPQNLAFDGTDIWVTNTLSNTVTKLLASTGAVLGTYQVGSEPYGVAFDGINIWVANYLSSTVTKLLASTGATVGTYPVLTGARAVTFDGANIWVTGGGVQKLLASTGAIVGTYLAGSEDLGVAFDGANIWVTSFYNNTVTELLASTGATVGTYPVGDEPCGVVFDGANSWVVNNGSNTVTRIGIPPGILPAGVVPIYSSVNTIQPGEWVSIFGSNLAAGNATWTGNFPLSLGGTSVTIDGKSAYLWSVSPGQINLQAPDDTTTGTVPVVVTTANGSGASTVTLAQFGPSFLLLDKTHVTGIILRSNGSGSMGAGTYDILGPTGNSLGYPTVAARAGDIVELFAVGLGPTISAEPAGQAFSGSDATTNRVQLSIGGTAVVPSFAGLSSAGLYQVNLSIPAGLGTGDLALVATVGGAQTQSTVVISLQ